MKLDYVLALKVKDFLERRLQTQLFRLGLAKSIHHARILIRQRHIRVGSQVRPPFQEGHCFLCFFWLDQSLIARLSISRRLLSDLIPKNTLILLLNLQWLVGILDAIAENAQRLLRSLMKMLEMKKSRFERVVHPHCILVY
jgi:hypothetical protein